jgi:hypothetical protein
MPSHDDDSRFGVAWSVGFALHREKLERRKVRLTLDDCFQIGGRVVAHLRMSNVVIEQGTVVMQRRYFSESPPTPPADQKPDPQAGGQDDEVVAERPPKGNLSL